MTSQLSAQVVSKRTGSRRAASRIRTKAAGGTELWLHRKQYMSGLQKSIHTHTHIYICVYIYICIYIYVCVCIYIYMCVCRHMYVYIYMLCVQTCACVCVCIPTNIYLTDKKMWMCFPMGQWVHVNLHSQWSRTYIYIYAKIGEFLPT